MPSRSAFAAMFALAWLVLASYAFARPATESLFLEAYTRTGLPWVWLAVALAVTATVAIYNRYAGRVAIGRLMASVAAISAACQAVLLGGVFAGVPHAEFALYVWKDVYIVVMVEVFWTFANCVFRTDRARWYYGLFLFAGALGGICGNLAVGFLAERVGTELATGCAGILLALVAALCWRFGEMFDGGQAPRARERASLQEGVSTFARSRLLPLMLGLILVTQFAITWIDYDFNAFAEITFPDTDARTKAIGEVYARIDGLQIVFQLGAGLVLRVLGVGGVLVLIPLFLGGALGAFLVAPGFESIATAKIASKVFDYSLFRAAKEMLYIPLSVDEKTQGKAIVDIFGYRVAKGGVSLSLLAVGGIAVGVAASWALAAIAVWVALTVMLVVRYRAIRRSQAD